MIDLFICELIGLKFFIKLEGCCLYVVFFFYFWLNFDLNLFCKWLKKLIFELYDFI